MLTGILIFYGVVGAVVLALEYNHQKEVHRGEPIKVVDGKSTAYKMYRKMKPEQLAETISIMLQQHNILGVTTYVDKYGDYSVAFSIQNNFAMSTYYRITVFDDVKKIDLVINTFDDVVMCQTSKKRVSYEYHHAPLLIQNVLDTLK